MRFIAGLLAAGISLVPVAGAAEGLTGERDFSFKRIKVGAGGSGNRITVQIDPAEQARIARLLVQRVTVSQQGLTVDLRTAGLSSVIRDMLAPRQMEKAA